MSQSPSRQCPLCGGAITQRKVLTLYGQEVCKKCYYGFANRRQLAFLVDSVAWDILVRIGAWAITECCG